jgi:uncharacterized protein
MKTPEDFPQARAELADFLRRGDQPEGTLTYHELEGFLFAIASAPQMVMPSEWLPPVFGEQGAPSADDAAEAEWAFQGLMGVYNRINAEVLEGRVGLPAGLEVASEPVANVGPDSPLGQWSAGFAMGQDFLEEVWNAVLPDEEEGSEVELHLSACWMTLTFFSRHDYALAVVAELEGAEGDVADWAASCLDDFEGCMADMARIGRTLQAAAPEPPGSAPAAQEPIRREKIGRNEPCPCGSGKKYKKCCLRG